MQCYSPRTVGFLSDGKTLCWSPKNYSKEYSTFQLPCGKCIACRLTYAQEVSIRCVHESQMYQNNSFVTLTYSEENLSSEKLVYKDFQDFSKRLRSKVLSEYLDTIYPGEKEKTQKNLWAQLPKEERNKHNELIKIPILVTGEYGDIGKRPHFHALLFNWRPNDLVHKYCNFRGDKVSSSKILDDLWGKGITELGDVTLQSANYCARYALKKLMHGPDGSHNYQPISKRSSRHAIGASWIKKYYPDVFNHGHVVLPDGKTAGIPRFYQLWFKKNHPELWLKYITDVKINQTKEASAKDHDEKIAQLKANFKRSGLKGLQISRNLARKKILEQKSEKLRTQKL